MTSHYGALILPSSVPALRREEVACMTNTTDLLSTNYFPPSRCVLGPRVSFAGSSRREPVRPERTGGILYFSSSSPPLRPRIISFPTHRQNTSALESQEGGGGEGGHLIRGATLRVFCHAWNVLRAPFLADHASRFPFLFKRVPATLHIMLKRNVAITIASFLFLSSALSPWRTCEDI